MDMACDTVDLETARLSVARGGMSSHEEHEHPEAQITVRLRAQDGYLSGFEPFTRIVPPYCPHKGGGLSGTASLLFHFTPQTLDRTAEEIYGISNFDLRGEKVRDPLILHLAEVALQEIEFGLSNSLLLDYIAHVLAGRLVRAYGGLPRSQRLGRTLLTARQLCRLREFIESRFDTPPTVREIAAVIGLGPQRFTAVLKASTGLTPHAYVTHLRIVSAGRLLKQNQLTLSEIALTLGFAGQSHFGSVFSRYFGVTPKHYRNRASTSARNPPVI
jgi:AraC-like DNA-binding protein